MHTPASPLAPLAPLTPRRLNSIPLSPARTRRQVCSKTSTSHPPKSPQPPNLSPPRRIHTMDAAGHGMLDDAWWLPFTSSGEDYDLGGPVGTCPPHTQHLLVVAQTQHEDVMLTPQKGSERHPQCMLGHSTYQAPRPASGENALSRCRVQAATWPCCPERRACSPSVATPTFSGEPGFSAFA